MQVCLGAHHVCSHAHPHQGFRHSQRDEHHYSDSTTSTIIVTSVLNAIIIVRSVISISMVVIDIFSIVTSSITLVTTLAPMLYDLNIPPRPATLPTASMEPPVPAAWVSCSGFWGRLCSHNSQNPRPVQGLGHWGRLGLQGVLYRKLSCHSCFTKRCHFVLASGLLHNFLAACRGAAAWRFATPSGTLNTT